MCVCVYVCVCVCVCVLYVQYNFCLSTITTNRRKICRNRLRNVNRK